jgi:hypothetical protein
MDQITRLTNQIMSAVRRWPDAMVKRLARRQAGRMTSRVLWKWFR